MEIDLLERSRARDEDAFRGLVSLWGDQTLRIALEATSDRRRAEAAVRDAFLRCWRVLPRLHSEQPFRPWLMREVVRAAAASGGPAGERAAAIASARSADKADRVVRALLAEPVFATLGQTFFDGALAGNLSSEDDIEIRRAIDAPVASLWNALTDARALPAWTSAKDIRVRPPGPLIPGTRIIARGAIAERRRSRDTTTIARTIERELLAWVTSSRVALVPGTLEFRWSIALEAQDDQCEASHRLVGVAFPPGASARIFGAMYSKLKEAMQGSMHRGLERLAALVEERARRTAP